MATDRYRRRRAAGAASRAQTRQRLLQAADELFRSQGYVTTTVAAIAARAGVSVQTLYLVWGSKRALLRGAGEAAAAATSSPSDLEQWRATIRSELTADGDDLDAPSYLAAACRLFVRVAERSAVYRQIHREAMGAAPEIAADVAATLADRRRTMAGVAAAIPARGLRPDVSAVRVEETLWALASPEMYDLFLTQAGYSPAQFEAWLVDTLTATLCER